MTLESYITAAAAVCGACEHRWRHRVTVTARGWVSNAHDRCPSCGNPISGCVVHDPVRAPVSAGELVEPAGYLGDRFARDTGTEL